MSIFSNAIGPVRGVALPPWLNLKFIGMWLAGLALLGLLWSWNDRGHRIQRLADFQAGVTQAVSEATVPPDKNGKIVLLKPNQIVPAIHGLQSSYTSAKVAIAESNRQTTAAKQRADASDLKLAQQLKVFSEQYKIANQKITFLENRKPVPADKVCETIIDDTNSAWDGWK